MRPKKSGPLRFASPEREREVCGTVRALSCRCGGALTLDAGSYVCGDCGARSESLFAPKIMANGPGSLGPP